MRDKSINPKKRTLFANDIRLLARNVIDEASIEDFIVSRE